MSDFFGHGHAMAERYFGFDAGASLLRVGKFGEPGLVERCHHLGGKDGVDTDIVGEELDGPFACEAENSGLSGNVSGGVALTRDCGFGADVHDGAMGLLESWERVMSKVVDVEKIAFERAEELFRGACGEADAVIDAGVVHEPV